MAVLTVVGALSVDAVPVIDQTVKSVLNIGIQMIKIGDWVTRASKYEDYGYLKGKIWEVTYASIPSEKTGRQFVNLKHEDLEISNVPSEMLQKLWISPF